MTWDIGERSLRGLEGSEAGVFTSMLFSPNTQTGAVVLTNVDWSSERAAAMDAMLTSIFDTAEAL
jgi:hypothetical protein